MLGASIVLPHGKHLTAREGFGPPTGFPSRRASKSCRWLRVQAKHNGESPGNRGNGSKGKGSAQAKDMRPIDVDQQQSVDVPFKAPFSANGSNKEWRHGPDVLYLPDLRKKLQPRPSPFVKDNYFGGGFVSDGDRVFLASMVHAEGSREGAGEAASVEHSRREGLEGIGALPPRDLARRQLTEHGGTVAAAVEGGGEVLAMPQFALRAGPRETIYHNPRVTNVAVVTVGGLCPGLNDVVRAIVSKAADYGVPEGNIRGIQFGFKGFREPIGSSKAPLRLTRRATTEIHLEGGTVLGTSSAKPNMKEIVKWLDLWSIDMLFVVGGIGGISVAHELVQECERREVPTSIIAVPKSIDNDILLIDRTFGFDTAVEEAQKALLAARVEASSAYRGVGLVKLMGRHSGFIAVKASLASGLVDVCLIPEVGVTLDGDNGLIQHLEGVLERKGSAMICVAEGAAQDLIPTDESEYESEGDNLKDKMDDKSDYIKDVGPWLKKQLVKKMKDIDVKYIDPSYLIRSVPPTANDRIYCKMLAHGAVHAGFAGYTGTMVGLVNTHYVYLPLEAGKVPRRVDPQGALWNRLRASTGQPNFC